MAHYTLELARACIAGDEVVGPYLCSDAKVRIVFAYPIRSVLSWDDRLGHHGSVTLVFMWPKNQKQNNPTHMEKVFHEMSLEGWEPVGVNAKATKLKLEKLLKENIKYRKKIK